MVNWRDPVLLLRDYLDLTKLLHAVGGLYIWETVFSAGFELSVLRGKRPYRWTIWIYLGTRYSCLLMFILFFILNDAGHVPCEPFVLMIYAFDILSWVFASLIIVLRVIAIWDYNILVSLISFSVWSAAFGLCIRTLCQVGAQYNPVLKVCIVSNTHSNISSAVAIPAADTILLLLMFVGLLRRAHGSKVGIWNVLYKQCIVWMIVAALVEIPPMVFIILNLNDAWNNMFPAVAVAFLSICAARMYRSLCEQGTLTEYSSPDLPQLPLPNRHRREIDDIDNSSPPPLHFHTRTTSGGTFFSERMAVEPFVFVPTATELMQQAVSGGADSGYFSGAAAASSSNTTLAVPSRTKSRDVTVQHAASLLFLLPPPSSVENGT